MRPLPRLAARLALLCGLGALASCPEPTLGQCLGAPGSLCVTVRGAQVAGRADAKEVTVLVRVGAACPAVDLAATELSCSGAAAQPQSGCRVSCKNQPSPARFIEEGTFTAELDLSQSPEPGAVLVGVRGAGCLAQGRAAFDAKAATLEVSLAATLCPRGCKAHEDCGGPGAAQICRGTFCSDPDPPPEGMVFIPAGRPTLGSTDNNANGWEKPCKQGGSPVPTLVKPFYIDQSEVTVAQLRKLCGPDACGGKVPLVTQNSNCTYTMSLAGNEQKAANCVPFEVAAAYCQAQAVAGRNKRLPQETEWEWAARAGEEGPAPAWYPWRDNSVSCERANHKPMLDSYCVGTTPRVANVGARPPGDTPSHATDPARPWPLLPLHDLAGNVAEWTETPVGNLAQDNNCREQTTGSSRIFRGGGWNSLPNALTVFARQALLATETDPNFTANIGLRCVLPIP